MIPWSDLRVEGSRFTCFTHHNYLSFNHGVISDWPGNRQYWIQSGSNFWQEVKLLSLEILRYSIKYCGNLIPESLLIHVSPVSNLCNPGFPMESYRYLSIVYCGQTLWIFYIDKDPNLDILTYASMLTQRDAISTRRYRIYELRLAISAVGVLPFLVVERLVAAVNYQFTTTASQCTHLRGIMLIRTPSLLHLFLSRYERK